MCEAPNPGGFMILRWANQLRELIIKCLPAAITHETYFYILVYRYYGCMGKRVVNFESPKNIDKNNCM